MKIIIVILFLCLSLVVVEAKSTRKSTSSPTPAVEVGPSRGELQQTVEHMQRLAKDIQAEADAAHTENAALKTNLDTIQKEKSATDTEIVKVQTGIDELREANQQLQKQVDTDKTKINHLLKLLHWWKLYGGLILSCFVAYTVWSCIPMVFVQYKIPATLIAFGITEGLVWWLL